MQRKFSVPRSRWPRAVAECQWKKNGFQRFFALSRRRMSQELDGACGLLVDHRSRAFPGDCQRLVVDGQSDPYGVFGEIAGICRHLPMSSLCIWRIPSRRLDGQMIKEHGWKSQDVWTILLSILASHSVTFWLPATGAVELLEKQHSICEALQPPLFTLFECHPGFKHGWENAPRPQSTTPLTSHSAKRGNKKPEPWKPKVTHTSHVSKHSKTP